jgi:hypothetical protein
MDPDPTPDLIPFFSDLKDAKFQFFLIFLATREASSCFGFILFSGAFLARLDPI